MTEGSKQLSTKQRLHILRNASLNTVLQLAIQLQVPVATVQTYVDETGIETKKEGGSGIYMNKCLMAYTFNTLRSKKHEF